MSLFLFPSVMALVESLVFLQISLSPSSVSSARPIFDSLPFSSSNYVRFHVRFHEKIYFKCPVFLKRSNYFCMSCFLSRRNHFLHVLICVCVWGVYKGRCDPRLKRKKERRGRRCEEEEEKKREEANSSSEWYEVL